MAGFRFTTPSATFGEEEVEVGVWQDDEDESGDADPSALGSTHGAPRAQSRHEVLRRKYTLLETIGQGAFGKVKRVRCRGSGALRAVKMIDKRLIGDLEDVMRYTREFAILNALKHRHIIQLHEVLHNDLFFYIVMDLCRGTLLDIIAEKGAPPPDAPPSAAPVLSEDVARGYFRQLVAGVEHAHKHLVLHRDIKPDNILVDTQGKLCLGDFGLSAMLADADAMLHTQVGMVFFFFFFFFSCLPCSPTPTRCCTRRWGQCSTWRRRWCEGRATPHLPTCGRWVQPSTSCLWARAPLGLAQQPPHKQKESRGGGGRAGAWTRSRRKSWGAARLIRLICRQVWCSCSRALCAKTPIFASPSPRYRCGGNRACV